MLVAIDRNGRTRKFSYLTSTDHSFQTDEAYSFDANGNRTNTGYSTGVNNQLPSDGTYSYEYDGEGIVLSARKLRLVR
jgi:hypothetical protein